MTDEAKVWQNQADVADAVAELVQRAGQPALPSGWRRDLQLEQEVAPESRVIQAMGWSHPLVLAFFEGVRARVGVDASEELRTAIANTIHARRSSHPWRVRHPPE